MTRALIQIAAWLQADLLVLHDDKVDTVNDDSIKKLAKVRDKHLKEKPGPSELEGIL